MAELTGCNCQLNFIFPTRNAVLNQLKITAGYTAACTPVQLYLDGKNIGLSASDCCGYWEFSLPELPPDGRHTLQVVSGCETCCLTVEIDSGTSPVPIPDILYPSGQISGNAPLIQGTALPGSMVRVCVDGSVCQLLSVGEDGSFHWQYPQPLLEGNHVVTAVTITPNGLESGLTYQFFETQASIAFSVTLKRAQEGSRFRTIGLELLVSSPSYPITLYYLMLPPGSDTPTAENIMDYTGPGLLDGTAAAGSALVNTGGDVTLLISGLEGAPSGALGLKDGYRYDIYLLAQAGQEQSPVLSAFYIRAMPFDGGRGTEQDPYQIRQLSVEEIRRKYPDLTVGSSSYGIDDTAHLLRNIDDMQTLYQESGGKYGVRNSMALDYMLTSPIDLSDYVAANGGTGWLALGFRGNEVSPAYFTGLLSGSGDETPIRGLTVIRSSLHLYEGLFAYSRNAVFRSLSLQNARIQINRSPGPEGQAETQVGLLSARMLAGTLADISVTDASVTIGSGIHDSVEAGAGGLVWEAEGELDAHDLYADNIRITITHGGYRTGGLFGRVRRTGNGSPSVSHALVRRCIIHSEGSQTAGIAGQAYLPKLLRDLRVEASEFTGRSFVAGIVGQYLAYHPVSSLAEDLYSTDNTISVIEEENYYCGGLFGQYNMEHAHTIRNCTATNCRVIGGYHIGGFAGGIELSGPQIVENCHVSGGTVKDAYGEAGGFTGEIQYYKSEESSGLPNPLITECTVQMAAPVAGRESTGGFAGIINTDFVTDRQIVISHCTTQAAVESAGEYSGGFIGRLNIGVLTQCTASGDVRSQAGSAGGIFGSSAGRSTDNPVYHEVLADHCAYSGSIQAEGSDVGGIGGYCDGTAGVTIHNCLVTSPLISGSSPTGRIIGGQSGDVILNDNYSTTTNILQGGIPKAIIENPSGPDGGTPSPARTLTARDIAMILDENSKENNSLPGKKGLK